jgi:hypothetical protein
VCASRLQGTAGGASGLASTGSKPTVWLCALQAARQLEVLSGLTSDGALDDLDHAASLTQHHDAVTGTAKQAVVNDYHRMIHKGMAKAQDFVNKALLHLAFPPAPAQVCIAVCGEGQQALVGGDGYPGGCCGMCRRAPHCPVGRCIARRCS